MKALDRWLIGIIVLVAVIVIAALGVVLTTDEPAYLTEDTPEAIVHNYLLAIQREDDDRALSYLAPTLSGLPADGREMAESISYEAGILRNASFSVQSGEPESDGSVRVAVVVTSYEGDGILGSSRDTRNYRLWVRQEGATWKLIDGNGFWGWSWDR